MYQRVFIFLLVIWAKVEASNTTTKSSWTVVLKVFENCMDKNDSLSCLQQKVLTLADRMAQSKSLEIVEGFKFVRDEGAGRSMSDSESNSSKGSLSDQIWNKIATFFETHSMEVNIPKFLDTDNEARKKKGHHGILLLAGAVKGAMIYMGMHAIAALAGKALIVAKVALTIASVIALKKLLEGGGGKTSYEIIKHPQHSYVQTHSSSHEYGGGGHGGGYEGHYRKRSIAKTKINNNQEFAHPERFVEASDSWSFKLPNKNPSVQFSASLNDADQPERTNNDALNQGSEILYNEHAADQSQGAIPNYNLFTPNMEDESGARELGEKSLNNDNEFTPIRLRRSRLAEFV